MTITLTKEELNEFQGKLAAWHEALVIFVFGNIARDPRAIHASGWGQDIKRLLAEFEKTTPKPNWRSLL